MKKEIIIIGLIGLGIFLVILFGGIHNNSSADNLTLFKLKNGQLITSDYFNPLEIIIVKYPVVKNINSIQITLKDGKGIYYFVRKYSAEELLNGQITLVTGRNLGIQRINLTVYHDKGEIKIYEKSFSLEAETNIVTGTPRWDNYYTSLKKFILKNRRVLNINGKDIIGYRSPDTTPIYLRDHTHQMKGFKYFEKEIKSVVDYFLGLQKENGEQIEIVWENLKTKKIESWRNEVEADPEYLAVLSVFQIWQATGDDSWAKQMLPNLEKGLNYSMTDPFRWSKEFQLVKRPFTIDTWDFEYHNTTWPYDPSHAKMCIMHGDNSGMYDACRKLAFLYNYFGDTTKSNSWNKTADHFQKQMNKICWNGKFYTHQIHIDPVKVEGVDEKQMLSLSNPYDINRGVPDHNQAVKIIQEYQNRKKSLNPPPFAEWFSLQPCFPVNSFRTTSGSWSKNENEYVNGGILPLVGGELAKASFNHGFEKYAVSILNQHYDLVNSLGHANLWYFWNGKPGVSDPLTISEDGWGSAAMLSAYMEGLAGVQDMSQLYKNVDCSPRWVASGETTATVIAKYGASNGYFAYTYLYDQPNKTILLEFTGSGDTVDFHLLLPDGAKLNKITADGQPIENKMSKIENSQYLSFNTDFHHNKIVIQLN